MTTPDQTPDTELEVQELTEENLEEVSGGRRLVVAGQGIGTSGSIPSVGDGATPLEVRRVGVCFMAGRRGKICRLSFRGG